MASPSLPPLPPNLKAIQHYLKTATEHDKRDPVVAYYCRLYAMQKGMEIDKKSPDCRTFLITLMDFLEKAKNASGDEAIQNEVVGQAHLENYALKVFLFADNEDRAARFNKNVVKSFYTAGMLFDVLTVFGEISEDLVKNQKYAKWKAAYIHKCLKSGETPIPGPLGGEEEDEAGAVGGSNQIGFVDAPGPSSYQQPSSSLDLPTPNQYPNHPQAGTHAPPSTPQEPPRSPQQPRGVPQQPPQQPAPAASYSTDWVPPANPSGVQLNTEQYQKAMKFCKYASSALQYEDSKTAIDNLTKALKLLTTGKES